MVVDDSTQKLHVLPTQMIETGEGIILKRGITTIRISGDRGAAVVQRILAAAEEGVTRNEIRLWFAQPDRAAVDNLLEELLARRILVWAGMEDVTASPRESNLDVFYWNFDCRTDLVADRVDRGRLAIIGVNHISQRLSTALAATGVSNFKVVDYHLLRNLRLFDETGSLIPECWNMLAHTPVEYREWAETLESEPPGCVVVTSDFGGTPAVREWNRYCIEKHWHFLPVVLRDLVGYLGPLVIPGETACYECLRARQNSHIKDPATARADERYAFEGQNTQGFHPSMASVLGDLAVLELTKFYSDCLPLSRVGVLIEVNLLVPSLVSRKVLKIPRCTVCGTMNTRSSPAIDSAIEVPQE